MMLILQLIGFILFVLLLAILHILLDTLHDVPCILIPFLDLFGLVL